MHLAKTSRQNRSILTFLVDEPVIMLPLPVPLIANIKVATRMFSPPWSHLTLSGSPQRLTPDRKAENVVVALLLVATSR